MKQITGIFLIIFGLLFLNACIKEEAPNKEADILSVNITQDVLKRKPVISNEDIVCYVKKETSLDALSPEFIITEGARISPESGTTRDFTTPQVYTVYSEDGQWSKNYTVTFISSDIPTVYHFDYHNIKDGKYHELYEVDEDGVINMVWASGNSGFSIVANGAPPEEYPTTMALDGFVNHSAKLVTRSTGALGEAFGTPIAAGNLFIGEFNLNVSSPLKSTHFGMPLTNVPLTLKGYYKYESGPIFKRYTDEYGNFIQGGEVLARKDSCSIYAVFYETDDNITYLDGTNILNHPNVVSTAKLPEGKEALNWTEFEIPFTMIAGKTIDYQKLKTGGYNLTIIFSSSKEGNIYNGAIGSTLLVDEVELITEQTIQ